MIRPIVERTLKFRVLIIGAAIVVMALGAAQLPNASVAALPEFNPPMVEIQTEALGLSAAEVEQLVTVPIEQDLLNGVAWLDQIRSESAPGLSSIVLIFEPGTDVLKARQAVQERLTQAHALPNVGSPPVMIQPLSSTSRVLMIGLSSKDLSLIDLSVLARWKIKPRLMGVPGVANVAIWGQRDRQLQVQVDPERLRQNGVTLDQVITTAGNALWVSPLTFVEASTPGTGGFIDTATQRFAIQHVLPITTAKDLSSVTIEDTTGRTLRLDQVATVVEDHQPLIGDAILADGTGLMLVIQKFPEANTRDVTQGVEQALAALRPGLSGVDIDTNVYQAESFVDTASRNLATWAFAGLALLILMVLLVLWSWRMAVIGFVTIVLALVAAAYALYLGSATFNMMVVAGLAVALGVVIADAMMDVGEIRRRLREHRISGNTASAAAVVANASSSVRGPLLYATAIILLASLPFFLLEGVTGAFTRPAAIAYVLAVLSSTVVAMTVAPVLAYFLLRNEPLKPRESPLIRRASRLFDSILTRYVRQPRWAYATLGALILMACAVAPQLDDGTKLPSPQDRNLLIRWDSAPGTSLTEMARITTAATQELRSIPGVSHVGGHLGRAITSDQVVNVSSGEMWVTLGASADYDATVLGIEHALHRYPGLRSEILTYAQDRVRAVQVGSTDAVVVRIYGHDLDALRKKADEVRQLILPVGGITEANVQALAYEPTLEIEVNLQAAQRFGLKPGDVRRAATTFYSGLLVGNLYEEQKVFDVVVQGPPSMRTNPAKVADLLIDTPNGHQVRLGDVASVTVAPYPTVIRHDATSRSLDVTAGVTGRDLGSVLSEVKSLVQTVQMPLEYHAEVLSIPAKQQSQNLQTAGLALAVAIGILLLLQAALGSWRLASMALLALPLAAAGGVVAAFLVGGALTFGALMGLFTVLGVSVRNTVVMIGNLQRDESSALMAPRAETILRSAQESAMAVLLTAGATGLAVLPLAVMGTVAGTEVLFPFAVVVLGGLVTSTLFAVLVLPVLYLTISPDPKRDVVTIDSTTDGGGPATNGDKSDRRRRSEVMNEGLVTP
jgi:CzcA family heavy metal efflux pump